MQTMDELHEPPLASRTQSAAKVWQNAVIRHNLIQLCERNTVVNLARVSKEAFIGAVAVLWAVQWCPIALQQAMNCVTDVVRRGVLIGPVTVRRLCALAC